MRLGCVGVNLGYIKMTLDTMRFQKMIGQLTGKRFYLLFIVVGVIELLQIKNRGQIAAVCVSDPFW